jgi:hypothetical protein
MTNPFSKNLITVPPLLLPNVLEKIRPKNVSVKKKSSQVDWQLSYDAL